MLSPIVSIIVPCYNSAPYIKETLDCIKAQTLKDWECVIVNDGSTDNTLEIVREDVDKNDQFIVIDKTNSGPADTRNVGIKASHGKYVLPLDSDDIIDPTYAEKAVNLLEKDPSLNLVYCKARYFGTKNEDWILPEYNYNKLLFGNQIFISCVFRRCDYDKTEGYNTNMKNGLEDWDFLLALLNQNSKVYQIPETLFFYRQHGESVNSVNSNASKHTKELYNRMVANHIDLYYPYLHHTILQQGEIDYLRTELDKILQSNAYKLGTMLLKPFKWLKSLYK